MGIDDNEFLAVFRHRYEIAAGQIGARRRTIEALPCISLHKSWLSGLVHGVVSVPVMFRQRFVRPRQKYDVSSQWATTLWAAATYLPDVRSFPPDGGAPALARDMLGQLTARGDGGIDHGELCRSTRNSRQSRTHRARTPHIGQPTAATRERWKINRTGDL
jgi:hypothetical protein